MLNKKLFRDIKKNFSQFITIFLMVLIGVMAYSGIKAYMDGMSDTANRFYTQNNLQDLNVLGMNFSKEDVSDLKKIEYVNNAERKLEIPVTNSKDKEISYLLTVIESNEISKFEVSDGISFDASKKGIWIDAYHAKENNIKIGDHISFQYDNYEWNEEVLGIIYIPDHVYTLKDASALLPDYSVFGSIYMSSIELEGYIKNKAIEEVSNTYHTTISEEQFDQLVPDFNYQDEIPYTYIMVDVDSKEHNNLVKEEIEKKIEHAMAMIEIEDTISYSMYQGEIDEGEAFVGIFSGLFLFIAMLSVITTMTRVVSKQRLQIGTLKALGFKNRKITQHYIGFGFWVSLLGAIFGLIAGRYLIGKVFLGMEMSYFEIPNGKPIISTDSYIVAALVVLATILITYITCRKELTKIPAESLRNELPKVKEGSLDLSTRGIFKKLSFSTKWNIRDIFRNKFRSITGVVGIVGCCTLIVCAFGMLNSMNRFIDLQFEDLYQFNYKLSLKEGLNNEQVVDLMNQYGNDTSMTINIELKDEEGNRENNMIFVDDSNDYVRFVDQKNQYIELDSDEGLYVTYKYAETNHYQIGDEVRWHVYGSKEYYTSKIVGFYRDPQVQGFTATKAYIDSLDTLDYKADTIYTNDDLSKETNIKNVEVIQDKTELKNMISQMLSMMKTMISIIIVIAIILGAIIIYNMGVLSYSEKQYQFSTLKVLGFKNEQIRKIFTKQNSWITIVSIIIGLPLGYYLTSYLFDACLDANYDFSVYIAWWTYLLSAVGTFITSYIVSRVISRKVKSIDMVSSLKSNE